MSGGGYFSNAGIFLIEVVFGLYIFAVMLRFFLQIVRADFYNPLCQAIVTVTNPPLRPLRRYIPAVRGIDTASVLLLLVLQLISSLLVIVLIGYSAGFLGLLVTAFAELIGKALKLFTFAVFIQIVLSWVAPGTYNPVVGIIDSITSPLLRPARRLLPPFGGIDFSPMLVIIALTLGLMLVVAPLRDFGRALM
ncbi:MAG: YggT family protein [Gammaproteobacteria bacterium]|jgi:YggT family protein|nr:YggT family protein [Gammaproteobacteria bacterium]